MCALNLTSINAKNDTIRLSAERDRAVSAHQSAVDTARCGGRLHALQHMHEVHDTAMQNLDHAHKLELKTCNMNILSHLDHMVRYLIVFIVNYLVRLFVCKILKRNCYRYIYFVSKSNI